MERNANRIKLALRIAHRSRMRRDNHTTAAIIRPPFFPPPFRLRSPSNPFDLASNCTPERRASVAGEKFKLSV